MVNHNQPIEFEMSPAPALETVAWPSLYGRNEFEGAELRPDWVFVRGIPVGWSLTEQPGRLCLRGSNDTISRAGAVPTFVARRMQHLESTLRTRLDFNPQQTNEEAGLVFQKDEQNHFDLVISNGSGGRQVLLRQTVEGQVQEVARQDIGVSVVTLEVQTQSDRFEFYVATAAGEPILLGSLLADGVRTRRFAGLMVGLYASGNG